MEPALAPQFEARLARSCAEVTAAQRLRYRVFVEEMHAGGAGVDHAARLERDAFDPHAEHLLLLDHARPEGPVVGVYRLLQEPGARAAGGWYSAREYDLAPLLTSGRKPLELGRSCLLPAYRGGAGMIHLWQALSAYVAQERVELLFGTASFAGTDVAALAAPLSLLHHRHLAPAALRPVARGPEAVAMGEIPETALDRLAALRAVPALIKAYLRLGGWVGQGAWVDRAFNTTDVCLVLDTGQMSARARALFAKGSRP